MHIELYPYYRVSEISFEIWLFSVKLVDKERFDKEQIGVKELILILEFP